MTVAENHERGHDVETAACDRWPLERVGDDRAEWHDLSLEQRREIAETLSTRTVIL